jgi:hypothetical protein
MPLEGAPTAPWCWPGPGSSWRTRAGSRRRSVGRSGVTNVNPHPVNSPRRDPPGDRAAPGGHLGAVVVTAASARVPPILRAVAVTAGQTSVRAVRTWPTVRPSLVGVLSATSPPLPTMTLRGLAKSKGMAYPRVPPAGRPGAVTRVSAASTSSQNTRTEASIPNRRCEAVPG